jgi:hypothetical protein
MSKRARATAALTAGVAAIAAVTAIPALTGAQSNGEREITVRLKVRGGAQVQHQGKGEKLAPGDAVFTRLAMFGTDGARLGSAFTECVNVGTRAGALDATLQCMQTYRFRDGQIVIAGVIKFSQLENLSVPIVGGSGAYRGASGVGTTGQPVKGFDSVDVLRLDG